MEKLFKYAKIKSLLSIISKLAAKDVPQWMPKWVHTDESISEIDELSKVEKKIPVPNFVEILKEPIKLGKTEEISNMLDSISLSENTIFLKPLIDQIKNNYFNGIRIINPIKIVYNDGKFNKTIGYNSGTSVIKILQNIQERVDKLFPGERIYEDSLIKDLNILNNQVNNEINEVSKVVFSTNPQDILAMSTRSDWTSCQNLFEGGFKEQAVYSALNNYTGIIYLSSGKDYKERGEEMNIRALVFFLVNPINDDKKLFIAKVYPSNQQKWKNLFKSFIEKHSNIQVISDPEGYFLPIIDQRSPYLDDKIKTFEEGSDKDIKKINLLSEQEQIKLIKNDMQFFLYIVNPTEKVQLEAVKQVPYAIKYIKNPSEKVQLAAVNNEYFAIEHIENPSEAVQLAAVNESTAALSYMKNPTEKVQIFAVMKDPIAINDIKEPTNNVQLMAVRQSGKIIQYIRNPSEEVKIEAIKQDPWAIEYIKNPNEEMQLLAVSNAPIAIKHIENPTEEVQLLAVSNKPFAIRFIKNPTEKVKLLAAERKS